MQPNTDTLLHLSRDPILKKLIDQLELKERPTQPSVYEALIRSINFQQLSGASARTIHNRFLDLFPDRFPDPTRLMGMPDDHLRAAGLSRQKAAYVRNTAQFFVENELMKIDWTVIPDVDIIQQLTRIKGVGRWTVEMILMFTLQRPDVLPLDDLVVKSSIIRLYNVPELKGKALTRKLLEIAEPWQPYRTTASLYMWDAKDTVL